MTKSDEAGSGGASSSGRKSAWTWMVALLAPLALFYGGRATPERPPRTDPASLVPPPHASAEIAHCIARFADPIHGLTGLDVVAPGADDWRTSMENALIALTALGGPDGVHTMIVTIADPIDSGLVYMFDEQLQAMELGMEMQLPGRSGTTRYFRDRSWLPWDDRYQEGDDRKKSEDCRRLTPGVVLLRGEPGVMVLLLVGESPTTGVHRDAMDRALVAESILNTHKAEGCSPGENAAAEGCTRVVGPTFSGAASSLARALRARADPWRGVQIISGSASGPGVPQLLKADSSAVWGQVTYQATTAPAEATQCAYLYLAERLARVFTNPSGPHLVEGTAILSESGTEFGTALGNAPAARSATTGESPCLLRPEVRLAFPFHVAALRDAYADQEKQLAPTADIAETIARRTSLPVSLRESRTALDVPANPSSKTIFAQDVALSHVLSEISREGIRDVAIEATDSADSIFLAQKIRDVAPDVRLVFLDADALFSHPDFERTLLGSFVISPYPFLGADDFITGPDMPHSHAPFDSAIAEGVFNAALAQRGAAPDQLKEYVFSTSRDQNEIAAARLPLWTSVIGHGELIPVKTQPALDCAGTIFGREKVPGQDRLCDPSSSSSQREAGWNQFDALRIQSLRVDPDVTPPRFWHFVFAVMALLWGLDWSFGKRTEDRLHSGAEGKHHAPATDRQIDVTVGRTKILFYLFVRRLTLAIGLLYMTAVYWIAWLCYKRTGCLIVGSHIVTAAIAATAIASCVGVYCRFRCEYRRLGTWRHQSLPDADGWEPKQAPTGPAWIRPLTTGWAEMQHWLGFYPVHHRHAAVYTPYAQIRLLRIVVVTTAALFVAGMFTSLVMDVDLQYWNGGPVPALTLFVLRTMPLANGVSFATPALLAILCAYLWAVGRAARLWLAHGLSRMTPEDGLLDGVSTPLTAILYPDRSSERPNGRDPEGFGREERALLNAIWSPSASPGYFGTMIIISFFPFVLFALKPPSSLERQLDTLVLAGAVGVCGIIVSATLIQLSQYWRSFGAVLKRIANHPLAESFKDVLSFVREDIDAQISRAPNDLSRLVACARAYKQLPDPPCDAQTDLWTCGQLIDEATKRALRRRSQGLVAATADSQAELGRLLVEAASKLYSVFRDTHPEHPFRAPAGQWVATVVTIILNRHVRQFRHLLYTMTGCAVILLLTTLSYPFEPRRAILTCLWALTLTVVFSGLAVFVAMNRDTLLSYVTKSVPGQLDVNAALLTRVVQWVVAPILLLAAAQYPDFANAAFRWVDPMIHALR